MAAKNKPNELQITRIYDAPVKDVWDAWTDPEQVAKWWGPRGFTLTTHSKDLRPGGSWIYTMHGPDGTDYPNVTPYLEVKKYSRLVYDHGANENQPPLFRVAVDFSEFKKGQTKMDMTMTFPSEQVAIEMIKFIKKAGGNSTWDRLAEYLSEESSGKDIFVINRSFDAPIDLMYEMFSNPKHLSQWLAPTGFTKKFFKSDIKPGGSSFYYMSNGSGADLYGRAEYLEMNKPNLLVYTQQFCDKNEKVIRHPMAPTWPETMLTTITLHEEDDGKTLVTIKWEVYGDATREEIATFKKERGGMTQGWTGSFDKLEDYLAKVK